MRVAAGPWAADCPVGASICVSGVCLTVASRAEHFLEFDVVKETLSKTTLGRKQSGDRVNLERSLRAGDRLDGHFVQGHVDGTATVESVRHDFGEYFLTLRPQALLIRYIVPKGSVAVEGVSLTVAEHQRDLFSVALVPTTLQRTNLASFRAGDAVNIETDLMVRTLVQYAERAQLHESCVAAVCAGAGAT